MSVLQPFPRPAGDVGLGAFSVEGPVITLQDLAQLEVRVAWDEAVSIVEELCVAAQGMVMRPIPAAKDIILNVNGTVAIRPTAAGVPDPVEAARRLHELLGGAVAPAPLRLFLSQAVSSGTYHSLSEFEEALAYFAKPGRTERVKAVHQRASEQLRLRPASPELEDPVAPVPAPPSQAAFLPSLHSRRQLALVGLGAAGMAIILAGLALYLPPLGPLPASFRAAVTAVPVTPVPPAAAAVESEVTEPAVSPARVTGAVRGQPATKTSAALDAVQMPLTGSRAAIRYTGDAANSRRIARPPAAAVSQPAVPAETSVAAPADGGGTHAASVQPVPPQPVRGSAPAADPAPAPPPEPPVPAPIYSASDTTVQPAVLTKPQLLPPAFADGVGKPIRMEFIVSPAGTVERARFLETPQRMADMMLLSSAMTWQFTPATKDGRPVRYRTVLSWMGAP